VVCGSLLTSVVAIGLWIAPGLNDSSASLQASLPDETVSSEDDDGKKAIAVRLSSRLPRGQVFERSTSENPLDSRAALQNTRPARRNVGNFIDPDDVPMTLGRRKNVGEYIDPEEVPLVRGTPINIGGYIDPEELPRTEALIVNVGEYMDPDMPQGASLGPRNVGDYMGPDQP